jgi:hypothetical protein
MCRISLLVAYRLIAAKHQILAIAGLCATLQILA